MILEIVSPDATLLNTEVEIISVPGVNGEFQMLNNHAPIVSLLGAKWVTQRGFVAEIYAGIGRDMLNQSEIEVVGRGGVSIGYRFN